MINFNLSGFGGQGALTAGMILAYAGAADHKSVTWYPSYGSEMRGGTANCQVGISDEEVTSPASSRFDFVVAMNEPSVDKFEKAVKKGGTLIVNSSIVPERQYRDDICVVLVPATDIANELDNARGANIVMLGSLIGKTELFERNYFRAQIAKYFSDKGKGNPKNELCFDKGCEFVSAQM